MKSTWDGRSRQFYRGTDPRDKQESRAAFQNVEPYHEENFDGFQYDEYHVEIETWDGIAANVQDNYDEFLKKGMDNEVDRSNEALFQAQQKTDIAVQDMDGMSVDHEYRLTLLELGLSETDI